MSRLQSNSADNVIAQRLNPWLNGGIPDYYDVQKAYKELGRLQAAVKRKQREISRAEETITAEQDKPRSNDARKAKLHATTALKDELSELEADLAVIEAEVKALEFTRGMFSSAVYRTKLMMDFA
jgi:DNA-binding transcriptional regulator GbsR (MarR family)